MSVEQIWVDARYRRSVATANWDQDENCRWPCCSVHGHPDRKIWDHNCDGPPHDKLYTGWREDFV